MKKSGDGVAQERECDLSHPDNEPRSHSNVSIGGRTESDPGNPAANLHNLMVNQNCPRSSRRAISECVDSVSNVPSHHMTTTIRLLKVAPIRGILKISRSTVRRTVSESHAGDEDTDEVFISSPDVSIDGEEKAKKSVHFNDRIYMNTFRSNSSILSRKNKTMKRTLRKIKKLSGSESSSDIESHEKSSSSTEDLKINDLPESTPTNNKHQGHGLERKVMVVKPLFDNGTIFTVTPVDDSELEEKHDDTIDKLTRPGRQDSGYDSEESREANEDNVDDTSQITWQEVKSKNRRRKNRKPHTDQLRKEGRMEEKLMNEE